MTAQRDPLSAWFDRGARELLARAYAAPEGKWTGTRLADPGPSALAWCAARGINPAGPDNPSVPGRRGGLNARDRWSRAFVRALYYQHLNYSASLGLRSSRRMTRRTSAALQVEVGRRVARLGVIPAGRAIRVRVLPGGRAADRAARAEPERDRIFTAGLEPGPRASRIDLRDW